MYKPYRLILLLLGIIPLVLFGQNSFPSYPEVLKKFYSNFSFEPTEYTDGIIFAKRKDGWYVDIVDRVKNDSIKQEQLFWSASENKYYSIENMSDPGDDNSIAEKINEHLGTNVSFNYYGYERCRYFGYNGWASDMIRDFSSYTGKSDTLIEGVARALSFYSSNYLWYQFGGANINNDSLMRPLGIRETPSLVRLEKAKYYIDQAIEGYKILQLINPNYKTLVGNSGMKLFNETMHGYVQMKMGQNEKFAKEFLDKISPDETLTAISKNYLSGCAPNSILFTFGDGDTYPLWYVQETQNYRKDVTVINTSLLGHVPWIKMFKKNNSVKLAITENQYSKKDLEYSVFKIESKWPETKPVNFTAFIKMILKKESPYDNEEISNATYPSKNLFLSIDPIKFRKQSLQPGLGNTIYCQLGNYALLSDLLILDIINSNIYSRPIYFSAKSELFPNSLQKEGVVYRLLPLKKDEKQPSNNSVQLIESFLTKKLIPVYSFSTNSKISVPTNIDNAILDTYVELSEHYFSKGQTEKASKWALLAAEFFYSPEVPITLSATTLANILIKSGNKEKAISLLNRMAEKIYELYKTPSALNYYIDKVFAFYFINKVKIFIEERNISSKQIDFIFKELEE